MLEPYDTQVSSTVLRGRGGSNTSLLPGQSVAGRSQRGRVVASSGEWRVASGGRIVATESELSELVVRAAVSKKRQNKGHGSNLDVTDKIERPFILIGR